MEPVIVNARGKPCPQPVVMTKNALLKLDTGQEMVVLVGNKTAKTNVENFITNNGAEFQTSQSEGEYRITVHKSSDVVIRSKAQEGCTDTKGAGNYVIAVKSNKMGIGSDELGMILVRVFINTIPEIAPLPGTVIFYNSGIEFALKDSTVLDALKEIEEKGVRIIVCGTCVQHFNQKDNVGVGTVSNMYEIMEILAQAGKVIYP